MVRSHLEHGDRVHRAYNHSQVKYIETVFWERIAAISYLDAKTVESKDDKYPNIPETACLVRCCISIQDDGMMANIQMAILCIMPSQDLNVNLVTNNNKCLFSWNSAQ